MDYVERLSGLASGRAAQPAAKLLSFTDLSPRVQSHLAQVYTTLALALLLSATGVWVSAATGLAQGAGMLGFMVCVPWMMSTPATRENLGKRRKLFAGAALSQGLLLAPLVRAALALHPSVLFTAFGATAGVFACFSAAALLSPRRSYLYLGGLLSSVLTTFMWLRLATWVFGSGTLLYQAELYGGLAVFSAYIVYDTQIIVERAEAGETDPLKPALDLLVDFVAVFVRLLVILLRNAERREQEKREQQGRRSNRGMRTTRL